MSPYLAARAELGALGPLPVAAQVALRVAYEVSLWAHRARSRKALRALDAHLLDDIGMTRAQAHMEACKRAWWP
ncbi:DUF1127 domain-containing protein [Roseovarius sp. LXJ103]|nr:DUF1127 domain-containing protein [Roseovarius carneus]PWE37176.1 hypothetical protein DD563_02335 [Pelagicola sp. LXJ1103]